MSEYNTRIKLKRDKSENWTSKDPILLDGEVILVDTPDGSVRKKIGDGVKRYSQLSFDNANSSVVVTLGANAWIDGQQTVSVNGLKADQDGIASLTQNYSFTVYEAAVAAQLFVSAQADGTLTFSCNGDIPQIDIPVNIILLG